MIRTTFFSATLLFATFVVPSFCWGDNLIDLRFCGKTHDSSCDPIFNLDGVSLRGQSVKFGFQIDRRQLCDINPKPSRARFIRGVVKAFFQIGDDVYEGCADLDESYRIDVRNGRPGLADVFRMRFENFFGQEILTGDNCPRAPKYFGLVLRDPSGTVFNSNPTAENFPGQFDLSDWNTAEFELGWSSGAVLGGKLTDCSAVPEINPFWGVLVLASVGAIWLQRRKLQTCVTVACQGSR